MDFWVCLCSSCFLWRWHIPIWRQGLWGQGQALFQSFWRFVKLCFSSFPREIFSTNITCKKLFSWPVNMASTMKLKYLTKGWRYYKEIRWNAMWGYELATFEFSSSQTGTMSSARLKSPRVECHIWSKLDSNTSWNPVSSTSSEFLSSHFKHIAVKVCFFISIQFI